MPIDLCFRVRNPAEPRPTGRKLLLAAITLATFVATPGGAAEPRTVFVSTNQYGVTEFADQRISADDVAVVVKAYEPSNARAVRAQVAEQLAVAESLAASRHQREKLRLQRQTLALERRREERRIIEAEARAREAADYRSWYWRPTWSYRRHHGYHPPGGQRPPGFRPPPAGPGNGRQPAPGNTSAFFPGPGR